MHFSFTSPQRIAYNDSWKPPLHWYERGIEKVAETTFFLVPQHHHVARIHDHKYDSERRQGVHKY